MGERRFFFFFFFACAQARIALLEDALKEESHAHNRAVDSLEHARRIVGELRAKEKARRLLAEDEAAPAFDLGALGRTLNAELKKVTNMHLKDPTRLNLAGLTEFMVEEWVEAMRLECPTLVSLLEGTARVAPSSEPPPLSVACSRALARPRL